jgi:hypothetical protein
MLRRLPLFALAVTLVCLSSLFAQVAEKLISDEERKTKMSPAEAAWELVLEENLGKFYLPIYKRMKAQGRETIWDFVVDDPKLPRVLLIGDSVSGGYTLAVRRALAGKANVHRAPENCGPTSNGVKKLDLWLAGGPWDVIHFNFGLHERKTKPEEYEQRLNAIVERLKKTGAKLIWATTTPVSAGTPDWTEGKVEELNAVAARVMQQQGIETDDLYATIKPTVAEHQNPKDVHFNAAGYAKLGEQVTQVILKALPAKKP